jgi:hypothetical protein
LPFDASGAGERAIKRRLVISLVVAAVGHAELDHVAFAMVRPFTATLRQVQVLVRSVVGVVKYLASSDLLAIVSCKVAVDHPLPLLRKSRERDPKRRDLVACLSATAAG